jgi:hypothetical protein
MELVLGSDHLMLASENDVLALIDAWTCGQSAWDQAAAIDRLMPCLRLHHMSPIYLASVVARSLYAARISPQRFLNAMAYGSISETLRLPSLHINDASPLKAYEPSRAPKQPKPFIFDVEVALAECMACQDGGPGMVDVMLGLVEGYQATLQISMHREPSSMGLYVGFQPRPQVSGPAPGPCAQVKCCASGGGPVTFMSAYDLGALYGFPNLFRKPWE